MDGYQKILDKWNDVSDGVVLDPPVNETEVPIRHETNKDETIDASHGSFDNNLTIVNRAIKRVIGKNPRAPVTDLRGYCHGSNIAASGIPDAVKFLGRRVEHEQGAF